MSNMDEILEQEADKTLQLESEEHKPVNRKAQCTGWLVLSVFSIVIGSSLQCGITIGCINRNQDYLEHFYNISRQSSLVKSLGPSNHWGLVVSIYALGGLIGSSLGGRFADTFGRRNSLIANNFLVLLGGIVYIVALNKNILLPDLFIMARILTGISFGISLVIVPMYLAEISPTHLRGSIGTFHQLGINSGILLTQIVGLPQIFGQLSWWPLLFGTHIAVIPFQLFTLPFCPKSPRHLVINLGKIHEARKGLKKLRGSMYDIEYELSGMKNEKEKTLARMSFLQVLSSKSLRKPLALSIAVQCIQQTNGMIIIFAYSNVIFDSAGIPKSMSGYGTMGTGFFYLTMCLVCVFLIDKYGRRTLLLTGLSLQSLAYILLTVAFIMRNPDSKGDLSGYVAIISMDLVIGFAALYVSIAWYITAELFTQGPRPVAMSIAGMSNRCFNFCISFTFPSLKAAAGNYTFVFFAVICILYSIFVYLFLPETKNKTFLEIQKEFGKKETITVLDGEIIKETTV